MSEVPLYLLRTSAVPGLYPKTGTVPETPTPDVIRKEPWPFYRTISGVRPCWELDLKGRVASEAGSLRAGQGYLSYKKTHLPRTLPQAYA